MLKAKTFAYRATKTHKPKNDSIAVDIRNSARWQNVRDLKRKMNPLCEDPFGEHLRDGISVAAEEVHHKEPIEQRPDLAFVLDNLMSVCTCCHNKIERKACEYVVVYGPPCSGKNTFVDQRKATGDMIIDVDALYVALGCEFRTNASAFLPFVCCARDAIIQRLRHSHSIRKAWIITTSKAIVDLCKQELSGSVIELTIDRSEAFVRAHNDPTRKRCINSQIKIIEDWFSKKS